MICCRRRHIIEQPLIIKISAELDISHARLTAVKIAEIMGFGSAECCAIRTGVSELANNLLFHTVCGGIVLINTIETENRKGIEITAKDEGPGIADINLAMQDGYSTGGGLGGGLGGVKRLMDEFEITSKPGIGTCITVRKWRKTCRQQ